MKYPRIALVALAVSTALGCSDKSVVPVDSPELRAQQEKSQKQADQDEVQYQKEQKKK